MQFRPRETDELVAKCCGLAAVGDLEHCITFIAQGDLEIPGKISPGGVEFPSLNVKMVLAHAYPLRTESRFHSTVATSHANLLTTYQKETC